MCCPIISPVVLAIIGLIGLFSFKGGRQILPIVNGVVQIDGFNGRFSSLEHIMIYATDELQNPLPLKIMLNEEDMNNPAGRSDALYIVKGFHYRLNIV